MVAEEARRTGVQGTVSVNILNSISRKEGVKIPPPHACLQHPSCQRQSLLPV